MIILINTPLFLNQYKFTSCQYPINLGYLASYLIKEGFEVKIFDYQVERFDEDNFKHKINKLKPTIVGFSCITPNILQGNRLASLVKEVSKDIVTIVGGPHVTAVPYQTLKECQYFDYGISGEGELTFLKLCKKLHQKEFNINEVEGVIYRMDNEIKLTTPSTLIKDIDNILFPVRNLVDKTKYLTTHPTKVIRRDKKQIAEVLTARGCPFNCFFCAADHKTRLRSIENVIEEVESCIKEDNTNHITLVDETFTLKKERVAKFCEYTKYRKLTFDCNSRIDTVDEETLDKMASSGCIKISFGIESGSQKILELINKRTNIAQIKNIITYAKKVGIKIVEGTCIIGSHPGETLTDVKLTQKLINSLPLDYIVVDIIVPYPGSPVNKYMKQHNLILSEDWTCYVPYGKLPVWRTFNFSPYELVKLQRKLVIGFYFRTKFILKKLVSIRSVGEVLYYSRMVIDFLLSLLRK